MLLLSGHSLTAARKVPLDAMSLQLNERDSSASITPADMTGITMNSWLQDDTEPGKGIVWRVRSIRKNYGTNTNTVQLEHAVSTLKDRILFGEVKTATMAGKAGAATCTAEQAVRYILKQQGDWALGTMAFSVSNPYKFDGETLFEALETVANSLPDCWWTYDFSTYPFKINFTKKSSETGTILRAGRNMTALTKNIDKSGMYTRHYPIGKNDLKLGGGGYVEKNTDAYGVISKTETDQTIDTQAELKRWSNERLSLHAEPVVTIDVEGAEISEQTGEKLDRIVLGRQCWIPLAEFGDTEILATITAVNYPDKLHKKEAFRATLANSRRDVTKILAEAMRSGGKSGRASAKKNKEDMAWFENTNNHVAMCAKGIIGVDAKGNPNWTRLSQIYVDGTGIAQTVETVKNGQEDMKSTITQHEDFIEATVKKVGDKSGKITPASIALSINSKGSNAFIGADHITLSGTTKLNDVLTVQSNTATFGGAVQFLSSNGRVRIAQGNVSTPALRIENGSRSQTINYAVLSGMVKSFSVSGNTLTLRPFVGDPVNFSKAVASWEQSWSGGNFTAKAQPQEQSCWTSITGGTASWNGRTVTIPIKAFNSNAPGTEVSTGYSASATYTLAKSDISCTRTMQSGEPTADALLTRIRANGWYLITINAAGTEKTYKIEIDVT